MFNLKRKKDKDSAKHKAHSSSTENEAVRIIEATVNAQKRSHFRLDCDIPAMIKLVNKDDMRQISLGEPHDSIIVNLSSGGARLTSNLDLSANDRLLVSFKLDNDFIALTGEMKFKSDNPDTDHRFQYGIMFTGTNTKDQDIICKYLFKEQMFTFS